MSAELRIMSAFVSPVSFPIGILERNSPVQPTAGTIEFVAIMGLLLFFASEVIAYLPIRENSVIQTILEAGRKAFPKPEVPESFEKDAE